jgi:uncharacterized LabA/DUF88 family protein
MEGIKERSVLLVDGANMHSCCRNLGLEVDYARLAAFIGSQTYLQRACYYTALVEGSEYTSLRPLVDWLSYNGYTVVTKEAKEFVSADGGRRIKGNMDIELAVDAMRLSDHVDHFYVASGDGDFSYLVEELQRRGRKVTILASRRTSPPMMADSLRRATDAFIDLADIREQIERPPRPAP